MVLHQVGILGDTKKPPFDSASPGNATTRPEVAAPPATAPEKTEEHVNAGPVLNATKSTANDRAPRYALAFPSGSEVTLRNHRGEITFVILAAQVETRSTGKLNLKFSIRATNKGRVDMSFGTDLFRLLVDGVPRAPANWLNDSVEGRSAKEGDITFEIPDTSRSLVLTVEDGRDAGNIPITLNKSG